MTDQTTPSEGKPTEAARRAAMTAIHLCGVSGMGTCLHPKALARDIDVAACLPELEAVAKTAATYLAYKVKRNESVDELALSHALAALDDARARLAKREDGPYLMWMVFIQWAT